MFNEDALIDVHPHPRQFGAACIVDVFKVGRSEIFIEIADAADNLGGDRATGEGLREDLTGMRTWSRLKPVDGHESKVA